MALIVPYCKAFPKPDEYGSLLKMNYFYGEDCKKHQVLFHENYIIIAHSRKLAKRGSKPSSTPRRSNQLNCDNDKRGRRKSNPSDIFLPLALTWIRFSNEEIIVKSKKLFTIVLCGPEGIVKLGTPMEKEKLEWVNALNDRLRTLKNQTSRKLTGFKKTVQAGPADIRYAQYTYEIGCTYKGEWMDGKPHGKGTYTGGSMLLEGVWHAELSAGYGWVIFANHEKSRKQEGWEVLLPKAPGVQVREVVDDTLHPCGLLNQDVQLLLEYGQILNYRKSDTILKEGEVNRALCWIKKGSVSFFKQTEDGRSRQIGTMNDNNFFGELSLLDKHVTACSVVADAVDTCISFIHFHVLLDLFKSNPGFSKRFNRLIASSLVNRVFEKASHKFDQGSVAWKKWQTLKRAIVFSGMMMNAENRQLSDESLQSTVESDTILT